MPESDTGQPLAPEDRAARRTAVLAALRQTAWEATQFLHPSQVVDYVESVMAEVVSDDH